MKFNPSRPEKVIADQSALESILVELSAGPYLAVDTESNSLFAYQEQVCLIQFTAEKTDYLIDTTAGLDLSCLHALFSDPKLEKIFHAAEYDVMCLRRDYGFEFNSLFDTMQAARILGFKHLGLSKMLEDQFKVDPVKSFQKANWGKRPLTEKMRLYARLDTHYLIPLRERLEKQLRKNGLLDLAGEDFQRLCLVENNHHIAPLYTHVSGYHHLSQRQLAVLDALCRYRDAVAARLDRPLFKVISARALYALAETHPQSMDELKQINELSPRLASRYGQGLLDAIQKGKRAPLIVLPKHKRPSREYVDRVDNLKMWRKNKGKKMGVQSDIVLPKDILENIADRYPKNMIGLKEVMQDVPWRFSHYSEEILQVIV
jgi:ribonuclease D